MIMGRLPFQLTRFALDKYCKLFFGFYNSDKTKDIGKVFDCLILWGAMNSSEVMHGMSKIEVETRLRENLDRIDGFDINKDWMNI